MDYASMDCLGPNYVKNIDKFPLYQVGEMFKEWSDISWKVPVIGLGIPSKNKFKNV